MRSVKTTLGGEQDRDVGTLAKRLYAVSTRPPPRSEASFQKLNLSVGGHGIYACMRQRCIGEPHLDEPNLPEQAISHFWTKVLDPRSYAGAHRCATMILILANARRRRQIV